MKRSMMSVLLCSADGAMMGRRCCDGAPLRRCRGCNEALSEMRQPSALRWSAAMPLLRLQWSMVGAATCRRCCEGAPPRRCRGCNEASLELRRAARAALEHRHDGVAVAMEHGRSCDVSLVLCWSTACQCCGCSGAWLEVRSAGGAVMKHRRPQRCWRCRA